MGEGGWLGDGVGVASTALISSNISKEDTGPCALTVILKIKRCDLVKMDAWSFRPTAPLAPLMERRIKRCLFAF